MNTTSKTKSSAFQNLSSGPHYKLAKERPSEKDFYTLLEEFGMTNTPLVTRFERYLPEAMIKPIGKGSCFQDSFQNFGFETTADFTDLQCDSWDFFPPKPNKQQPHSDYVILEILLWALVDEEGKRDESKIVNCDELEQSSKLFRFLAENRPFFKPKNGKDLFLFNKEILEFQRLLKKIEQPHKLSQDSKPDLERLYQMCFELELIDQSHKDKYEGDLRNWQADHLNEDLLIKLKDKENSRENEFSKVKINNKEIFQIFEKRINKNSIYFIKTCLEDLWDQIQFCDPQKDSEDVKYLTKKSLNAMKNSILNYEKKFGKEIFQKDLHYYSFENVEKVLLQYPLKPQEIWIELLKCYNSYLDRLELFLICDISDILDAKASGFFQTLLRHSLSFLASKKALQVNWNLVDALNEFYAKSLKKLIEPTAPIKSRENIFAANLVFILNAKLEDIEDRHFTSVRIENKGLNFWHPKNELPIVNDLIGQIFEKLDQSVKSFISRKGIEIFNFEKIEIQFFFREYDQFILNLIEKEIGKRIIQTEEEFEEKYKKKLKSIETICFYTTKKKMQKTSEEILCQEISFFNYKFLELILYKKPSLVFPYKPYFSLPLIDRPEETEDDKIDFPTRRGRQAAKEALIKKLEKEGKLRSIRLRLDYGTITYKEFFEELTNQEAKEKEINKKWIQHFKGNKTELWEDSGIRMIKEYVKEFEKELFW